jgi:hypothetical protein
MHTDKKPRIQMTSTSFITHYMCDRTIGDLILKLDELLRHHSGNDKTYYSTIICSTKWKKKERNTIDITIQNENNTWTKESIESLKEDIHKVCEPGMIGLCGIESFVWSVYQVNLNFVPGLT